VPFSSARKWASTTFADRGSWYLGAPEILLTAARGETASVREQVDTAAHAGHRVLLLARSATPGQGETLPADLEAAGVVLLEDEIRPDSKEILEYFAEQGLTLKVISGDNPATVAAVAQRAGVAGADTGYDARQLPDEPDALAEVLETHAVFGRVQPHQKQAMVGALQATGHVVAMTGDGVNDVLALKSADMGIAMGTGSAASRAVAQLTLLDNRFSTLPRVLAEGRRVINNIERVANLFVTKATYAVLLAALTGILGVSYPFLPRQLTLIGTFSIGVPGFFLALEANSRRSRPGFIGRVLRFSIPSGIVTGSIAFVVYFILYEADAVTLDEARTGATFVLLGLGLVVLAQLTRPIKPWKVLLVVMMGVFFLATLSIPFLRDYFEIDPPPAKWWTLIVAGWLAGAAVLLVGPRLVPRWGAGVAEHS
jgi:cation-transporting ATPase E